MKDNKPQKVIEKYVPIVFDDGEIAPMYYHLCPECRFYLDYYNQESECPSCGQKLEWEELS